LNKKAQISSEDFELIENYLDGNLDSTSIAKVETRLSQEEDFRINVEEIRDLREGIQRAALKEKLNVFHMDIEKIQPEKNKIHLMYWAIAASISLFILAGIWWATQSTSPQEKIFQSYYHTDPGLISTMSSAGDYEFARGMVDFKLGEYTEAVNRWDKLLADNPSSDTLNYFLGLSYLELDDFQKSKQLLSNVTGTEESYFYKDANWYLGLIMVKEGNFEAAIPLLDAADREEATMLISILEKEDK
tara:strand:- start:256159 stop:256896 length:738 start_codon:yes stop_codon:yes gene_type:complete